MGWSDIVSGDLVVFFVILKSMVISVFFKVLSRRLLIEHHDDTLHFSPVDCFVIVFDESQDCSVVCILKNLY